MVKNDLSLDDSEMDKIYHELGGHGSNSQKLSKDEQELIDMVDKALDSIKEPDS